MHANWSLILNIVLLVGVVMAMWKLFKARNPKKPEQAEQAPRAPSVQAPEAGHFDDIIAIRKVMPCDATHNVMPQVAPAVSVQVSPPLSPPLVPRVTPVSKDKESTWTNGTSTSVMIFLLAKEQRLLGGYELLQMVLAAGLRFGEGQIFHRHQHVNGQGPVMCSLAAATASGTFDLDHIGAFTVRGLCLFMQASGNATIDAERFEIMLDTAKQLSEGLDTYLLDERRQVLSDASVDRYHQRLGLVEARVLDEVC